MKSILFFFLFATSFTFAQPTKGTFVIGGSASFNFNKQPTTIGKFHTTNFSVSPSIGHFISSKYQLEYGLGYKIMSNLNQTDPNNFNRINQSSYSFKFGLTRFFPLTEKLYFTIGAYIQPTYEVSELKNTIAGVASKNQTTAIISRINVSPGLTYFINQKWMLYSYVGVINYDIIYDISTDRIGQNFNANISFNSFGLGVRYILGKGAKTE